MSGVTKNECNKRKPSISWAPHHNSHLLDLWMENILAMRSAQKNNHIYQRMAEKLKEAGMSNIQWKDIRTKIDNLTRKYKEELKLQGTSGGAPSKWVHYHQVHRILGNIKSINVAKYIHQSTDANPIISEDDASTSIKIESTEDNNETWDGTPSTSTQRPKRRKTEMSAFEVAMVEATNRRTDELVTIAKDLKDLGERRLKILERMEKPVFEKKRIDPK